MERRGEREKGDRKGDEGKEGEGRESEGEREIKRNTDATTKADRHTET